MRCRKLLFAIGILLLPHAASAQDSLVQARRWFHVSVVADRGLRHEDVTLEWVGDGVALRLTRADGAKREYRPGQILAIYDQNGNNLLAAVAAAKDLPGQAAYYPAPEQGSRGTEDEPSSGDQSVVSEEPPSLSSLVDPPMFNWLVGIQAGPISTSGDGYYETSGKFSWGAISRVRVARKGYVFAWVRWVDLGRKAVTQFWYPDETVSYQEWSLTQLMLGYGRYSLPNARGVGRLRGFWELGLGVLLFKRTDPYHDDERRYSKLGLTAQGGGMLKLGDHSALEVSVGLTFKPGFMDAQSGGAAEMGARAGFHLYW